MENQPYSTKEFENYPSIRSVTGGHRYAYEPSSLGSLEFFDSENEK
jgi:hypothetical protein